MFNLTTDMVINAINQVKRESRINDMSVLAEKKNNLSGQKGLRINIGCGADIIENYINIDIRDLDPRIICGDARDLPIDDESAIEIRAIDLLNHISYHDIKNTLSHWNKKLQKSGLLYIKGRSFKSLAGNFLKCETSEEKLILLSKIFGYQDCPENTHLGCLDSDLLERNLKEAGFTDPKITLDSDQEYDLIIEAYK